MGYYTSYELALYAGASEKPLDDDKAEAIIAELRKESSNAEFAIDEKGCPNEAAKWYDSDDDLRELSKKHPDVLFMLSGEGEENNDLWQSYFLNGKSQQCSAEVIYPPFDAEKLK